VVAGGGQVEVVARGGGPCASYLWIHKNEWGSREEGGGEM